MCTPSTMRLYSAGMLGAAPWRRHCAASSKTNTVHIIPSHDCASTPRTKTSSTAASGAPAAISCNTLFSFASASCARLRCRDVAEAPYTANISLLDQLNCRILLENASVLQLQDIKSLRCGRGDNFLDPRQIPGWVFRLRANVIPQLASMSRYHHVRRNSPKLDVLLVEFPDVICLVNDE